MKRRIAAVFLVTLLPLGMAACGSQSKADACKEVQAARQSIAQAVVSSGQALPTDPTAAAEQLSKIADAYKDASNKISNDEVKPAVDKVIADLEKMKNFDPASALSGAADYMAAVGDLATHQNELNSVCGLPTSSN